jgi:hypothetical protein
VKKQVVLVCVSFIGTLFNCSFHTMHYFLKHLTDAITLEDTFASTAVRNITFILL